MSWRPFDDVPQELDASRTLPMQDSPLRPPKHIIRLERRFPWILGYIGLAMSRISSTGHTSPEFMHHLLCCQITPYPRRIALIAAFVKYHRFTVLLTQGFSSIRISILYADVCDIWIMLVEYPHAIVYAPQMPVRIFLHKMFQVMRPIVIRFLFHKIKLVCHTPPHILISGKTGNDIIYIAVIVCTGHTSKSPSVIRMEHNQVRFYA